jgi:hypothetical protein
MDELEVDFAEMDFLPGIDLYLWLRLVVVVTALVATAVITVAVVL